MGRSMANKYTFKDGLATWNKVVHHKSWLFKYYLVFKITFIFNIDHTENPGNQVNYQGWVGGRGGGVLNHPINFAG